MEEKKDIVKKKKKLGKIGIFLIYLVASYLFGHFFGEYLSSQSAYDEMPLPLYVNLAIFLIIFLISLFLHVIFHEAGHLVFGLLCGYEFISFRVGSFTIIKEEGKYKIKRFNLPGTGGQCLLLPPKKRDGDFPVVLYNLGGIFINALLSILAIVISLNTDGFVEKSGLILFAMVGIFIVLTNGIPFKTWGAPNDAYNILSMIKDKDAKESFYVQLWVHAMMTRDVRIKDLPPEIFELKQGIDYTSPLNLSRILMSYSYHLDKKDFVKAKEVLNFGKQYVDRQVKIYALEMQAEELFMALLEGDTDTIEALYDRALKKYIRASKYMISKKRLMVAYEGLYKKDQEKALQYYKEINELAKKYPIKAEAKQELMLTEYIKEKIEISSIENENSSL